MSIVESTKLDPSLNYRTVQSTRSSAQYRKLYPSNGGQRKLQLKTSGASQNLIFNIPAECVNLGKSYLEYDLQVIAQEAGQYAWIRKDVHGEFDSIMYRDTGSMAIVDVKNLHLYNELTSRLNFSADELKFNDDLNGLVPTNAPLSDVKSIRFDNTACSMAFIEPQQLEVISGANADSTKKQKRVYLKDLVRDSYFGLAKNQIMPIETYLEINFSAGAGRVGFRSDSAANPTSAPTPFVDGAGSAVTLDNICLNLCVEQNQDLVKMLKAEVAKGISLPIPWTRVHTLVNTGKVSSYVYNLPLDNKQHGQRIKRLIYAPIQNGGGTPNLLYDHRNINGARISEYATELDNQKMQRDHLFVSATNKDDYMYHKELLKDTLYFNQPIYNQNWIHVDSFDYGNVHDKVGSGVIMVDGLNLDKPMTYTFNSFKNTDALIIENVAIVCGQKLLNINASSFIVA